MKKIRKNAVLLSTLLCLVSSSLPAMSCSFASETYFTYTSHPDIPLNSYADGKLGILQSSYARSYLLVAYRYLSGSTLSADEQAGMVKLWNERLSAGDFSSNTDTSGWLKARAAVPGAAKIDQIYTDRAISKEESWQTFCNCQTPAFDTATKTLQGLITKYGAGSATVKDWLDTQDKVFSNCGGAPYSGDIPKANIPNPLPASADVTLAKDRAYQIASANFYAQNYAIAAKEFESIAADAASPWSHIAGYLAIRALIREASLNKLDKNLLAKAGDRLKELSANPSYANLSADLAALASFIAARITPEQHLQELSKEKISKEMAAEFTKTIDNLVGDSDGSERPKYSALPDSVKKPELVDWIMSFQSTDDSAKQHIMERWKKTHSLPWLVAAATIAAAKDADANAIIAECQKNLSGPAHWTLFYQANRLSLKKGNTAKVRCELDKVLANPPADLPSGSLNQLKTQRLALAQNLDEFVKFGVQVPEANCSNGGTQQVPDDLDQILQGKASKEKPLLTGEAGNVIATKLPLSALKDLAANTKLPKDAQNNIAWTSWVRAVLIQDDAAAAGLAQVMKALNKAKEKLVDAYLAAKTPEDKKFAAANLMLQFSSAQPTAGWGQLQEDAFGDSSGWWWGASPVPRASSNEDGNTIENIDPLFLTPAEKATAAQQIAKLDKIETAPNYLGKIVLAYAKTHPDDPRLPQALHFVVSATHYGSTDDASKGISKQAFQLLHTKYKTSPWTKKTPYFY